MRMFKVSLDLGVVSYYLRLITLYFFQPISLCGTLIFSVKLLVICIFKHYCPVIYIMQPLRGCGLDRICLFYNYASSTRIFLQLRRSCIIVERKRKVISANLVEVAQVTRLPAISSFLTGQH